MYKIKWLQIEMLDILKYLRGISELLILAASMRKWISTVSAFPSPPPGEILRKENIKVRTKNWIEWMQR